MEYSIGVGHLVWLWNTFPLMTFHRRSRLGETCLIQRKASGAVSRTVPALLTKLLEGLVEIHGYIPL